MRAEQNKVAVVGGGLAGLSAALYLANNGVSVTVFEKSTTVGGRAKTTIKDGFHMNIGPHAFYKGGTAEKFLALLDINPEGAPPPIANAVGFFEGKKHQLPLSLSSIITTSLFSPIDKVRALRFFAALSKIDTKPLMGVSVNEWINASLIISSGGKALKEYVRTLLRLVTYGGDMDYLSAGAAINQLQYSSKAGVIYIHGGWAVLVEELRSKGEAVGVKFVNGTEVKQLYRDAEDQQLIISFQTNNEQLANEKFDSIILAVPPKVVNAMNAEAPKSNWNKVLIAGQPTTSVRAACLDLCLSKLPEPTVTYALGVGEPLYYSVHSAVARLTPERGALIHLAYYLTGNDPTAPEIEKRLEKMLDDLQPGWQNHVVFKRFLANIDVTHKMPTGKDGKFSGFQSVETEESDVYRAGDWVGTEFIADASLDSARQACELILGKIKTSPAPNALAGAIKA